MINEEIRQKLVLALDVEEIEEAKKCLGSIYYGYCKQYSY